MEMRVFAAGPEDANLVRLELWADGSGCVWAVSRVAGEQDPMWATADLAMSDWRRDDGDVDWARVQECLDNTDSATAADMVAWLSAQT